MKKLAALIYGVACYALGMASFVYLGASLANVGVPNAIDAAPTAPFATALLVNVLLVGLFAVQHTVMARPAFKARWTKLVPRPVERSTYVLLSAVAIGVLLYFWQPLGGPIWTVTDPTLRAVIFGIYGLGWVAVVSVTFLIDHFDLFGVRQVVLYARGREYTHLPFGTPGPYNRVRHPLYVGWLIVFWTTPTMTVSHLLLAGLITTYILVAVRYEERDLLSFHGERYAEYRKRVPMLVPALRRPLAGGEVTAE